MSFLLKQFLPLLIGPLTGYVTTYVMDFIDDFLKLTASWPAPAKQGMVIVIAALATALNQQFGLALPTDMAGFFGQPNVQTMIAAGVAFFVKHAKDKKAVSSGQ